MLVIYSISHKYQIKKKCCHIIYWSNSRCLRRHVPPSMCSWTSESATIMLFIPFQGCKVISSPLLSFCSICCSYVSLDVQYVLMSLTWYVELNLCIIISVLPAGCRVHKVYRNELHLRLFVIQELIFSLHAVCTNHFERYNQGYHMQEADVYWQTH